MEKRIEMIHEKLFKQFNINPDMPLSDKPLKLIPKNMKKEIIRTLIEKIGKYQAYTFDDKENRATIIFDDEKQAQNFSKEFSANMIKHINEYLQEKGFIPQEYYRILSIATMNVTDNIFQITF